jgi:hypothetical protein
MPTVRACAHAPDDHAIGASAPDLRTVVQCVGVGLGVSGALWHAAATVGLPGSVPAAIAVGLLLTVLQAAWSGLLLRSPDRRTYVLGAGMSAATLLASAAVLGADSAFTGPAQVVGLGGQLALLLLCAIGMTGARGRFTVAGTRAGLVVIALTMSALVGGVGHAHPASAATPAPTSAGFLCHLV